MAKKVFTDESLSTFVDEIKAYTDEAVSTKANETHTHSWNELEDKPFGEEVEIVERVATYDSDKYTAYFPDKNNIVEYDEFSITFDGNTTEFGSISIKQQQSISYTTNEYTVDLYNEYIPDELIAYCVIRPTDGSENHIVSFKATRIIGINPIDEKYIPSTIPRTQTATIGQVVKVQSTDENGTPTEWVADNILTKNEALTILMEAGIIEPLVDEDGSMYINDNGEIYIF